MLLNDWLKELEEANRLFDQSYMERVREVASRNEVKMADLRKEIIGVFRSILKHLEAHATISGGEIYNQVAKEINEVVDSYNRLIVNRASSEPEAEEEIQ